MVADYRGLDVTQLNDVRTELLKHGARFSVVKNTLAKRAAEEAGVPSLVEMLDGPTAIAFVGDGDMVAVAKALSDAARETKVIAVKGGILDGETISADQVKDLASLPPADVLKGQVLAVIVGPMTSIVGIFTAPLRDFVGVVDARIRQLEEQGETVRSAGGRAGRGRSGSPRSRRRKPRPRPSPKQQQRKHRSPRRKPRPNRKQQQMNQRKSPPQRRNQRRTGPKRPRRRSNDGSSRNRKARRAARAR